MIFSSGIFIFAFLPAFLAVYYLTPNRYRNPVIVLGSYIFYGWWRLDFLALLIGITVWNYTLALLIHRAETVPRARLFLTIGVSANLLALAYFKYFNFGIENFNALLTSFGGQPLSYAHVILPIGISFFVFQSISYLIDIWRKDSLPARSIVDLAAFKALFPQLIAGPVLRYKDLADQFASRVHSWEKFGLGTRRFVTGLAMKVLIADSVAPLADRLFAGPGATAADAWIGTLAYTVQLYFDFAGYSSMAVGLGLMMGFTFIENFNAPYVSRSITEFWRRWHISLSTWLRDYLYIPLGGNRLGTFITYRNLVLTMVIGGFWHGANWTFLAWGTLHGVVMALERAFGRDKTDPRLWPKGLNWVATMLIVIAGWVLFRSPDLATAGSVYAGMLGANGWGFSDEFRWALRGSELAFLLLGLAILGVDLMRVRYSWSAARILTPAVQSGFVVILFTLAVTRLSANSFSPFLYFQF